MINQETVDVAGKLRSSRSWIYALSFVAVGLAIMQGFFVAACLQDAAYPLAAINAVAGLVFLSPLIIFLREKRVLSGIISEIEGDGATLAIHTIHAERCHIESACLTVLSPAWTRKRRFWLLYFLRGNDAARQASAVVKVVMIHGQGQNYYWVCTDLSPIMKYADDNKLKTIVMA